MNSDFEKKLFNYQVKPPASAWNEIAAALDETVHSFPAKLLQYAEAPSKNIWSRISLRLNAIPGSGRVISMGRGKILQYTAVAAMLLLVVYGGYLMIVQKGNEVAQQQNQAGAPQNNVPETNKKNLQNSSIAGSIALSVVPEVARRKTNYIRVGTQFQKQVPSPAKRLQEKTIALQEKNIVNASSADRYMIATSNTGNVVRLPKKAYADFACVEARDLACKEKMATMQSKLASASMSTDFAGVLDLLKNLQDNK